MSDPLSAFLAFLITKFSALFFSLGGALLILSFTVVEDRSYIKAVINIIGTWFIGYALGSAVNAYFGISGDLSNFIYVISSTVGLLILGGIYQFASDFKKNPAEFIDKWRKK